MIMVKSEMCVFSQLICFATLCFNVGATNKKTTFFTFMLLKQGYRNHKLRKNLHSITDTQSK